MNFDQIEIALESFQTNEASTGRNPKDYGLQNYKNYPP